MAQREDVAHGEGLQPGLGAEGDGRVVATSPGNWPPRTREIVGIAARLFASQGYHQTSMDDIARACGIKKPTLYHYFSGKAEIVFGIHEIVYQLINSGLQARLEKGTDPAENLLGVLIDIMEVMDSHEGYLQVYFEHHPDLTPEYQETARRKRDAFFDQTQQLVREVFENNGLDPDATATGGRLATLALFGMVNWSYQWYRRQGSQSASEIASYFHRIWLNGVLAGPQPSTARP